MEWYKDIDNAIFPTEDDKDKSIYRIIPFDTLLQMLTEHKNYLVKTSRWEDSYENFFLISNNSKHIRSLLYVQMSKKKKAYMRIKSHIGLVYYILYL